MIRLGIDLGGTAIKCGLVEDGALLTTKNGDKVKLRVRFRGMRELSHMNLGEDLMKKFVEACAEYGTTEKAAVLEGKNYMIVISPKQQTAPKKAKNAGGETPDAQ